MENLITEIQIEYIQEMFEEVYYYIDTLYINQ